jgi:hypothetical protein
MKAEKVGGRTGFVIETVRPGANVIKLFTAVSYASS